MPRCPTCGADAEEKHRPGDHDTAATPPPGTDLSGQVVGERYRLLRRAGAGSMGEVYEASHLHIQQRVAIKLLRAEYKGDGDAVQHLQIEARAASAIDHPNVVKIRDFGHTGDGRAYLAMEWLDGTALDEYLDAGGALPLEEALTIAAGICAGLAAAHEQGIVHRDLKPGNVLLCRDERGRHQPRIVDFGIARLSWTDPQQRQSGSLVGTPHYMAPEQIRDGVVDGRTDIYAMGVLLYELVTGSLPFEADDPREVIEMHLGQSPEPPSQRLPDRRIPPALDALILRCLHKEPSARPARIADLIKVLDELLRAPLAGAASAATAAEEEEEDDLLEDLEAVSSRSRRFQSSLLFLVLGGALTLTVYLQKRQQPGPSRPPTALAAMSAQPRRTAAELGAMLTVLPAVGPDDGAIVLEFQLGGSESLRRLIAAGSVRASIELRPVGSHGAVTRGVPVERTGQFRTRLPASPGGRHEVALTLLSGQQRLGAARFTLCRAAARDGRATPTLTLQCP